MRLLFVLSLFVLSVLSINTGPTLYDPPVRTQLSQVVSVTFRDFLGSSYSGSVLPPVPSPLPDHPDFQNNPRQADLGIVGSTEVSGAGSIPTYAPGATGHSTTTHSEALFDDWYTDSNYGRDVAGALTFVYDSGNSTWSHPSFRDFFPLDGKGWGDQLADGNGVLRNFGFTMQFSNVFVYTGIERLTVSSDDDCFVYANGNLVLNNGGIHVVTANTVDFTSMGFVIGERVYLDIFYAERHTPWATFDMDTNIFFGPGVKADPHFIGYDGATYDVMGEPNKWFNIFSDTNFQFNAYYVAGCESKKDVTAISQVGILIGDHRIHLDITCNATLDETTDLIKIGTSVPIGKFGIISHIAPQVYIIETTDYYVSVNPFIIDPKYQIEGRPFHGEDCIKGYFNFNIYMKTPRLDAHGILGQTAHHIHNAQVSSKTSLQGEGEIEGVYTDYIVSDMYAHDNIYSRYSFDDSVSPFVASKQTREVKSAFNPFEHTYEELVAFMEGNCKN